MGEILSKFELLDTQDKQQLLDYLDFLLSKKDKKRPEKFDYKAYRERILVLGIWSDEDIAVLNEARQNLNNMKIGGW
jgi:hypothetical protein